MRKLGMEPADARVVVQGSGNVGGVAALLLHREGYKIVSMSDMYGTILNEGGLDVPAVMSYLKEHRRLEGFTEAEYMPNGEQLELDCEILIPAATENQITSRNVDRVKARLIVEGANGPTTAEASRALDDRGVMVVPDILANAGGVTVSYFEWVQDRMGYFWTEDVVNSRLEQIMATSFEDVFNMSKERKVSMRIAAYILAIDRVATVYRLRGVFA
jgi:glutamate dehydrogenase (NAD(P)+)